VRNLLDLEGKTAVVTGGAKGIGAATARALEHAGARVAIFDLQGPDDASVDVTSESAVQEAFARAAEQAGGIDILVNNAGRVARKPAVDLEASEWQAVIDVNLTATFLCSRTAHPYMKKRGGGSIVNVASIMGLSGGLFPNASYQASKGGVVNLTRALALEWAADGIRVNAVAPTFVDTEMTAAIFSNPDLINTVMQHTPLGRLPVADDVAAAILFLCSDAARCVTGIVLPVDSGYLAR
jgi:NAD(P)-dependent dehydrogenase (short-subunit alcohol dehydrogenase family)